MFIFCFHKEHTINNDNCNELTQLSSSADDCPSGSETYM